MFLPFISFLFLLKMNGCGNARLHGLVSQTKYTKDLFKKFNMQECKGMSTPMPTSGHLDLTKDGEPVDQKVYRSMIGS